MNDIETLREMTARINDAENRGDRDYFCGILAPKLAFQRADPQKTVDDRVTFLQKVTAAEPGHERVLVKTVEPVHLHGGLAAVSCVIHVDGRHFYNLRLFVKREGTWKLLGWANEPE